MGRKQIRRLCKIADSRHQTLYHKSRINFFRVWANWFPPTTSNCSQATTETSWITNCRIKINTLRIGFGSPESSCRRRLSKALKIRRRKSFLVAEIYSMTEHICYREAEVVVLKCRLQLPRLFIKFLLRESRKVARKNISQPKKKRLIAKGFLFSSPTHVLAELFSVERKRQVGHLVPVNGMVKRDGESFSSHIVTIATSDNMRNWCGMVDEWIRIYLRTSGSHRLPTSHHLSFLPCDKIRNWICPTIRSDLRWKPFLPSLLSLLRCTRK